MLFRSELASPSDEGPRGLSSLRRKMATYQANGARLAVLLLPNEGAVEIWPAEGPSQRLAPCTVLEPGEGFPGLRLELAAIWSA